MNVATVMMRKAGRVVLIFLIAMILVLLLPTVGRAQTPAPPTPTAPPTAAAAEGLPAEGGTPDADAVGSAADDLTEAIAARTPIPTPTPGFVQREVREFTTATGLNDTSFLGLATDDWINLGVSILIFAISYWLIVHFLNRVLHRLVKRTDTQFDDQLLGSINRELKWMVGVILLRYSILRLDFLSNGLRTLLDDAFFVLGMLIGIRITVKLIDFGLNWYQTTLGSGKKRTTLDPAIMMLEHVSKLLVYITAASIALSHFGLANNAISIALLGIGIVALLSIKDVITDIIYGFIILVGQPFREGDAVHIASMAAEEWGWVDEIGARDTRIRTLDNRTLVVPNSAMGAGQITNYTFPDPTYRVHTDLHLAYGSDFDEIQQVLKAATLSVDGVLPDKPVEVIFWQYGASMRIVRVRWWIASCAHDVEMVGLVNAALEAALTTAKIPIPYTTVDLNISTEKP